MPFISQQTMRVLAIMFMITLSVIVIVVAAPLIYLEVTDWIGATFRERTQIALVACGLAALTTWLYA